jgi:hypothetical protein
LIEINKDYPTKKRRDKKNENQKKPMLQTSNCIKIFYPSKIVRNLETPAIFIILNLSEKR